MKTLQDAQHTTQMIINPIQRYEWTTLAIMCSTAVLMLPVICDSVEIFPHVVNQSVKFDRYFHWKKHSFKKLSQQGVYVTMRTDSKRITKLLLFSSLFTFKSKTNVIIVTIVLFFSVGRPSNDMFIIVQILHLHSKKLSSRHRCRQAWTKQGLPRVHLYSSTECVKYGKQTLVILTGSEI